MIRIGTLVEVMNEAGYYSSNMQKASTRTTSRIYKPLPKRKPLDAEDDMADKKSIVTRFMPKTGSLADKMQRARYNSIAKYSRSA